MKIIIGENDYTFENKVGEINKLLDLISRILTENNQRLYSLIIDDVEVFEDIYQYILMNINSIRTVQVVIEDLSVLVKETIISSQEYIANAVFQIEALAETFYQFPTKQSWLDLADLLGGVEWILKTADRIDRIKNLDRMVKSYEEWNQYVREIMEIKLLLPSLNEAIVIQDSILIADILMYELKPAFSKAHQFLISLITYEEGIYAG